MEHIVFHNKRVSQINYAIFLVMAVILLLPCSLGANDTDTITEDLEQLNFAHGLFQRGLYDMAITEYKKMITLFPNSGYVHEASFGIAESLFFAKSHEQAVTEYEKYLKNFPQGSKASTATLRIGQLLFMIGSYDQALKHFRAIKSKDLPDNLVQVLYFYTGKVYKAKDDRSNALKYLNKASEVSKKADYAVIAFLEAGNMLLEDEMHEQALKYYEKAYASATTDEMKSLVLYKQAETHFSSGNYTAAAEMFRKVLKKYPNSDLAGDALANLLLSLSNLNQYQKVISTYLNNMRLLGDDSRFFNVYYVAASAYAAVAKYNESLSLLNKSLSLKSLEAENKHKVLLKKAEVLLKAKRFGEAVDVLEKQLKDAPKDSDRIAFLKAEAYYELQHFQDAVASYKQIIDDFPESVFTDQALYAMAYAQRSAGNQQEAIKSFLKYFQEGKDDAKRQQALYLALLTEIKLGMIEGAIKHSETFLATFKDRHLNENVLFRLGTLYAKAKRYKEAVSAFKRFVEQFVGAQKIQEAYFLLAYNAQQSGNAEEALAYYKKITPEKNELFYSSLMNAALLHLQRKENDVAASTLDQIIMEFEDNDLSIDIYVWLARYYVDKQNFNDALHILEKAKSKQGAEDKQMELAYLEAESYRNIGEFKKAINQYNIILPSRKEDSHVSASHIGKGLCLMGIESFAEAEDEFATVIREYPEDNTITMRARFEIAKIKERTGNLDEACRFYMLVAVLYRHDYYCPQALFSAAQLFESLEKYPEARKAYQEIVDEYKKSPLVEKAKAKLSNLHEQ